MNFWKVIKQNRYVLVLLLSLLVVLPLYWRNPYNLRTLIANLEPYPDTFHYLLPPLNWLRGHGFVMWREGGIAFPPSVPPLYSLFLLPWLAITQDVRIFFLANLVLTGVAAAQIWQLLRSLTKNWVVTGLGTGLFLLNPYTIWLPNLAMSENLFLVFLLWSLWLLSQSVTPARSLQAGLIAICFYATKYASAPLTALFPLLYAIKMWPAFQQSWKQRWPEKTITWWLAGMILSVGSFLLYQELIFGHSFIDSAIGLVQVLALPTPPEHGQAAAGIAQWAFSLTYVSSYAPRYLQTLVGRPDVFLWHISSWWPMWFTLLAWVGMSIAWLKQPKWRFLLSSLLIFLMAQLLFMSTFYAFDMRYFILAYPILLLFLMLGISNISKKEVIQVPVAVIIVLAVGLSYFSVYKTQLLLNFRSAETPWYFVSVQELDRYLETQSFDTKPVVISAMNPYYFDLMGKGEYELLPLSDQQDFFGSAHKLWGKADYSDLPLLYRNVLESGRPLYIAKYGLGNVAPYKAAYAAVEKQFVLEEVVSGCHELCNIYRVVSVATPSASGITE